MKVAHFIPQVLALAVVGCGGGGSPPKPPIANACTAYLEWAAPTNRMDGTPLPLSELDKFTIYVSESPDPSDMLFEIVIDVNDQNVIAWEVRDLSTSQHYFWVTATDTIGRESGPSNVRDKNCPT